ncbi:unnamed protein product [Effrenium voratum]|nr:unnamed protein product [Effrenium voratum]
MQMAGVPLDVQEHVSKLLAEASDGDRLVATVHKVLAFLESRDLVYHVKLAPDLVGVHPSNRDGYGLNSIDVYDLLDSIVGVGFISEKVNAVACEVEGDTVRAWNQKLVASSNGALGRLEPNKLKAVTLCGSHTNFALRVCKDELPHNNDLICVDGRISLAKIKARDSKLYEAVTDGVTWRVLAKEVAASFPNFLQMLQQYGNASLQRGEHELQVLRRIHGLYTQAAAAGRPDFAAIKKKALASKPACAHSVPAMYQFALKACGGSDGAMLADTEQFVRQQCASNRQLGTELWEILGQDGKGKLAGHALARFRHAIIKLAYARQCDPRLFLALSFTDMALAAHVLNIKLNNEKKYESMGAIAHDYVLILRSVTGQEVSSRWHAQAQHHEEPSPANTGARPMMMRELQEDGSFKDPASMLSELGFEVGGHVRRKSDRVEGKINEVLHNANKVKIEVDGNMFKVPLASSLSGEWQTFEPKAAAEAVCFDSMPSKSLGFRAAAKAASILLALQDMADRFDGQLWDQLQLQLKPSKALLCTANVQKGKLTLIPATPKVGHRLGAQEVPANTWEVQTDMADEAKFWVVPHTALPKEQGDDSFLHPFWQVQATPDEDMANMELIWVKGKHDSTLKTPCFRNSKAIKHGEKLLFFKEKRKVTHAPMEKSPSGKSKKGAQPGDKKRKASQV